jgi:hypothetical protein
MWAFGGEADETCCGANLDVTFWCRNNRTRVGRRGGAARLQIDLMARNTLIYLNAGPAELQGNNLNLKANRHTEVHGLLLRHANRGT